MSIKIYKGGSWVTVSQNVNTPIGKADTLAIGQTNTSLTEADKTYYLSFVDVNNPHSGRDYEHFYTGAGVTFSPITNDLSVSGSLVLSGTESIGDGDIHSKGGSDGIFAIHNSGAEHLSLNIRDYNDDNLGIATFSGKTGENSQCNISYFRSNVSPAETDKHNLGDSPSLRWNNVYANNYYGDGSNLTCVGGATAWQPDQYQNLKAGCNAGAAVQDGTCYNIFIGHQAGRYTSACKDTESCICGGDDNVFVGFMAGHQNTTGSYNIFTGSSSGYCNTSGDANIALGNEAGRELKGNCNIFLGSFAGRCSTTGNHNIFMGHKAGFINGTCSNNIFLGYYSGINVTGATNVAIGNQALLGGGTDSDELTGQGNVAIGPQAAKSLISSSNHNTFIGNFAGECQTAGSYNVIIGANANTADHDAGCQLVIGGTSGDAVNWLTGTCDGDIKPFRGIIDCANSTGSTTETQVLTSTGTNIHWATVVSQSSKADAVGIGTTTNEGGDDVQEYYVPFVRENHDHDDRSYEQLYSDSKLVYSYKVSNDSGQVRIGDGAANDYSVNNDPGSVLQLTSATSPKLVLIRNDISIVADDYLGMIDFNSRDGGPVRAARIGAIASGVHGTGYNPTDLVFRNCPSLSASDVETLRITSEGHVGIGTTNPLTDDGEGKTIKDYLEDNNKVLAVGVVTARDYYGTFKGTIDASATVVTDKIIEGDTSAEVFDTADDQYFKLEIDGEERYRINTAGISTFNSDQALVARFERKWNSLIGDGLWSKIDIKTGRDTGVSNQKSWITFSNDSITEVSAIEYQHPEINGSGAITGGNNYKFKTYIGNNLGPGNDDIIERIRITGIGSLAVGVGTQPFDPSAALDVRVGDKVGDIAKIQLYNGDQGNTLTQTAEMVLSPDIRGMAGVGISASKENDNDWTNVSANRDMSLALMNVKNNKKTVQLTIKSDNAWGIPKSDGTIDYGTDGQVLKSAGDNASVYWADETGGSTAPTKIQQDDTSAEVVDTGSDGHFKVITEETERLRIDKDGRFLLRSGTTESQQKTGGFENALQVEGIDASTASISITRNSDDEHPAYLNFGKSRGTSVGSDGAVMGGDIIGQIDFTGSDGSGNYNNFAGIHALVDGLSDTPPPNGHAPGRLIFKTCPSGSTNPLERLRIGSSGQIGVGKDDGGTWVINYGTSGQVLKSQGDSSPPVWGSNVADGQADSVKSESVTDDKDYILTFIDWATDDGTTDIFRSLKFDADRNLKYNPSTDLLTAPNLTVTGNTILGDANSDTTTFNSKVKSHILPEGTDSEDQVSEWTLGEAGAQWKEVHAKTFYGAISGTIEKIDTTKSENEETTYLTFTTTTPSANGSESYLLTNPHLMFRSNSDGDGEKLTVDCDVVLGNSTTDTISIEGSLTSTLDSDDKGSIVPLTNSGVVLAVSLRSSGTGYPNTDPQDGTDTFTTTSSGTGTGLTLTLTISTGGINSLKDITVDNRGEKYAIGDIVTLVGGNSDATLIITDIKGLDFGSSTKYWRKIYAREYAGKFTGTLTSRNIAMTGDVAWDVNFDGSDDVTAAGTIQEAAVDESMLNITNAPSTDTAGYFLKLVDANGTLTWSSVDISGDTAGTANTLKIDEDDEDADRYLTFVDDHGDSKTVYMDDELKYNPNQNILTVNKFIPSGNFPTEEGKVPVTTVTGSGESAVYGWEWGSPDGGASNTATNLAGGQAGDLPYQSAANTTAFLSISTTEGDVLKVNTSSGLPEWGAAPAGSIIQQGDTSAEVVDTGSDGHFKVVTENTERLRIESAGQWNLGNSGSDAVKYGESGYVLKSQGKDAPPVWGSIGNFTAGTTKIATIKDQRSTSGTGSGSAIRNGGDAVAGANYRVFNTLNDPHNIGISLLGPPEVPDSDTSGFPTVIKVPAGTYSIKWSAPAYNVKEHNTVLLYGTQQPDTASSQGGTVYEVQGSAEYTARSTTSGLDYSQTSSTGMIASVTFTQTNYIRLKHWCREPQGTYGLGSATWNGTTPANIFGDSVFTQIQIEDLSTAVKEGTTTNTNINLIPSTENQTVKYHPIFVDSNDGGNELLYVDNNASPALTWTPAQSLTTVVNLSVEGTTYLGSSNGFQADGTTPDKVDWRALSTTIKPFGDVDDDKVATGIHLGAEDRKWDTVYAKKIDAGTILGALEVGTEDTEVLYTKASGDDKIAAGTLNFRYVEDKSELRISNKIGPNGTFTGTITNGSYDITNVVGTMPQQDDVITIISGNGNMKHPGNSITVSSVSGTRIITDELFYGTGPTGGNDATNVLFSTNSDKQIGSIIATNGNDTNFAVINGEGSLELCRWTNATGGSGGAYIDFRDRSNNDAGTYVPSPHEDYDARIQLTTDQAGGPWKNSGTSKYIGGLLFETGGEENYFNGDIQQGSNQITNISSSDMSKISEDDEIALRGNNGDVTLPAGDSAFGLAKVQSTGTNSITIDKTFTGSGSASDALFALPGDSRSAMLLTGDGCLGITNKPRKQTPDQNIVFDISGTGNNNRTKGFAPGYSRDTSSFVDDKVALDVDGMVMVRRSDNDDSGVEGGQIVLNNHLDQTAYSIDVYGGTQNNSRLRIIDEKTTTQGGTRGTQRFAMNRSGAITFKDISSSDGSDNAPADYGLDGYVLKSQGHGASPVWDTVSNLVGSGVKGIKVQEYQTSVDYWGAEIIEANGGYTHFIVMIVGGGGGGGSASAAGDGSQPSVSGGGGSGNMIVAGYSLSDFPQGSAKITIGAGGASNNDGGTTMFEPYFDIGGGGTADDVLCDGGQNADGTYRPDHRAHAGGGDKGGSAGNGHTGAGGEGGGAWHVGGTRESAVIPGGRGRAGFKSNSNGIGGYGGDSVLGRFGRGGNGHYCGDNDAAGDTGHNGVVVVISYK